MSNDDSMARKSSTSRGLHDDGSVDDPRQLADLLLDHGKVDARGGAEGDPVRRGGQIAQKGGGDAGPGDERE